MKLFSRRLAVTAALVTGALILGIAFATWTATGSGSGEARSITATASAVTGAAGTADLYPGFVDGDLYFDVDNPNPYDVQFTDATFGAVTSSAPVACPAANVTTDASASGLTINVAAGSPGTSASIADVVNMALAAPDGCQGVTFTIAVTLSGTQV